MKRTLLAATMACALSVGVVSAVAAIPSPAFAACGCFSLKDNGQVGGAGGYFLTDEGHNNLVETTGTGTRWYLFNPSQHHGRYYFELLNTADNLCLNVASNDYVYMGSCVLDDAREHFGIFTQANGASVWQNYATSLNLTALGIQPFAPVVVSGGPGNGKNEWIKTEL